jgi:hypothetical protein
MWNWLKKLVGTSLTETEAAADIHLKASTEAALSRKLSPGQEGWITYATYGVLSRT